MPSASRFVAVSSYLRLLAAMASAVGLASCGGTSVNGTNQQPSSYTLGGTISGPTASGLVLANNGTTLSVNSGFGLSFTFPGALSTGTAYAVTVQSSPTGLTCSVANGTGTVGTANISNVVVTCSDKSYSLGGSVSGLTTSGLVLANGTDQVSVPSGATTFTLPTPVAYGSTYSVTVAAQPQGLSCSVQNGTATMGAGAVTNIAVTCSDQTYTLGGNVSGLTTSGLVLANGSDTVHVNANATTFTFPTSVAFSSSYAVTVASQPTGLTCSVSSGSGTMPANNVTSVAVVCSNQSYTLGGSITGLTSSGLVLANGSDTVNVNASATSFIFPTAVASGSHYAVLVQTQPAGLTCTVSSGTGTMPASNVTSVVVTCATTTYTLGGTISGLTATGLVLANNGTDHLSVAAHAASFTMPTGLASGSAYAVTVVSQPLGVTCTVTNGSGTIGTSDVTNVQVTCSSFTWTWESGLATAGALEPASAGSGIVPGARDGHMTWKDSSGNFWLFGGSVVDSTNTNGGLNDVWVYNVGTGAWVWKAGSGTVAGAGGLYPGSYNGTGTPPGRQSGTVWVDSHGTVWLFGGQNASGYFNDLWTYDSTLNQWTWVGGTSTQNDPGTYTGGTLVPRSRAAATSWMDAAGHLWLFGGVYLDTTTDPTNPTLVPLNDLWRYDTTARTWTKVSGSAAPTNASYGTQGQAAPGNVPGGRAGAASWVDGAGLVWIFGGAGLDSTGAYGNLNDLWTYNTSTGLWTWVGGSNTINSSWTLNGTTNQLICTPTNSTLSSSCGTVGVQGAGSTTNIPSGRLASVAWTDSNGRFWLFGGAEFNTSDPFNDLWSFDPTTLQWTWVNGPHPNVSQLNAPGTYGTQGTGDANNQPGARYFSAGWADANGHLWLFGGYGMDNSGTQGYLNDLWKF